MLSVQRTHQLCKPLLRLTFDDKRDADHEVFKKEYYSSGLFLASKKGPLLDCGAHRGN
jgi:hypothetical protein